MVKIESELYHYGVKGQRWYIRRYQYSDGSLTPAGIRRYRHNSNKTLEYLKEKINNIKYNATGKYYVNDFIQKGTTLSRIQTSKDFISEYAFYSTMESDDIKKYIGLFGENLKSRAVREAVREEKEAIFEGDVEKAKTASINKEKAKKMPIYQLKLTSTKALKIPSDEDAANILNNLMKERDFCQNVKSSINDAKSKMIRPIQSIAFKQAENALKKDLSKLTNSEKKAIYKAFNLTLVFHNEKEVAAQNRFYKELIKKGYSALLDYNDKEYSSYHAKKPIIVFDTSNVMLNSVTELSPKTISRLNAKYNAQRARKEITANTISYIAKLQAKTMSEVFGYTKNFLEKYQRGE